MATFYTGNTGRSTGPHLDFRVWSHETGGYVDPTAFTPYVKSGDGGLGQFRMTSPYGANRGSYIHKGIDYATEVGTPITVDGRFLTTFNDKGGGITSQYEIEHNGKKYDILLMHGNADQNPVLSSAAVTDGVSLAGNSPVPVTVQKSIPDNPAPAVVSGNTAPGALFERQAAKTKAQVYKAYTAADIVKQGGNNFDQMKSSRLGDALAGAQESIIQKRMDAGENFGGRYVSGK